MKHFTKRSSLCMLLTTALLLSLAGCGSSESEETETATEAETTTETETGAITGEAGSTYTGTVSEISETSITLVTDTETVTIALSESTTFSYDFGMGGEAPNGNAPKDAGEAPDDADSNAPEDAGEAPDDKGGNRPDDMGESMTLTWENVTIGDTITVVVGDDGTAETVSLSMSMDNMGNAPDGQSSGVDTYDAVTEYTEDTSVSDTSLTSTGTDENAILVSNGANVTMDSVTMERDSDDSTGGDNSSFYGVGATALVTDGTLTITDSSITSDAAGGAGVFSYGDGVAYVSDTTITTQQDTSGGIHVAGGGTLYAWDLNIETQGESSAAIRSDRGSGTMVVSGGTYISNGVGSPAVYSTADITVNNATLTANGSEAICIEGLNTIRLFDCDLTGNMSDSEQNDCTWNVILYQSMSGDSEVGNSTFEMTGGTLTAKNGGMFYTTNTESTFVLSGVEIICAADSEYFLKCTGNSNQRGWGTSGANGADCHFTGIAQVMEGDVIWDTISQLDFYLTDGSTLTGAFINDETAAGDGGDGYAALYIDETSSWIVTGGSTLTELQCAGIITDADGNTVTIQGTDGTVYVQGTGNYTITVENYSDTADVSGASSADSWDNYAVEKA